MTKTNDLFDKHLKNLSPEAVQKLFEIRHLVESMVPKAILSSSYGVPAFKLDGKTILMFAGFKNHVGIYPTAATIEHFKSELTSYEISKGTIRFPLDKTLPIALIKKIVLHNSKI